jgi:FMN phosphatase YigB (HAD superfamily)
VKPDPAIYRLARERFGCERALFIDDRADNAAAASSVPGWEGHRFTDAETLEADLTARGLL